MLAVKHPEEDMSNIFKLLILTEWFYVSKLDSVNIKIKFKLILTLKLVV